MIKSARAYRHWKPDELRYMAEHYGLICDKTLAARLQRTESAIITIASLKCVLRKMNFYTASTLAKLLGIPCHKQVLQWVKRGWLKGRQSAMSQGKRRLWRFSERGVVRCLKQCPWLVDLKCMERHYFRSVVIKEWERDPWYTAEQAAPLLGFTKPDAVYRYIHRGWLPAEKKPCLGAHEGEWIIRLSAIEVFLENDPRPIQECIRWKGRSGSATYYCIGATPGIDCPPGYGCAFSQFKPVYHRMINKKAKLEAAFI